MWPCLSDLRKVAAIALFVAAIQPAERSELQDLHQPPGASGWLDPAGRPTKNAYDALSILSRAADEGLEPADYEQDLLGCLTSRVGAASCNPSDRARFDAALTDGMLRFLHDVHNGRVDPRDAGFHLTAPPDPHDYAALLHSAIVEQRVPALVESLRPSFSQYQLLRQALTRYRALAADPAFAVPTFASTIHPGDACASAGVLRDELAAFGDLSASAPAPNARYEGALVDGVKHFQQRHGLLADGVIGAGTAAALRVPPAARVRQIELALERLRWMPHLGDDRLIVLNIPMFRLWAWDVNPHAGAPALGMDVIVGRALNTQTPVFVEEMREVIFRPYWNVPSSILRHEVLPKIARDPDYLRRENMEFVPGGGVRQRPGPKNALGLIKFVFPNEHDVYMHGTPAQALFAKSRRDFSHGCVRVFDPVSLAEWVLRDRPEWTRDRIVMATNGTETIHVQLRRPIPVILYYTTAAVTPEDATVHFADDIYRQDAKLDRALATRRR